MKKIILYLTTSTVLLLTCLGYHVNHLFPKDIPFDNSDKARSALAGMTIETTFGMQDSGRTLYLDLKDGEITQRYTRQSTQEKQKDYEISMERIFEMDEQTKKTIGKPKNLSEEGHEIKRVIPQADAAYVFYSSNNICCLPIRPAAHPVRIRSSGRRGGIFAAIRRDLGTRRPPCTKK